MRAIAVAALLLLALPAAAQEFPKLSGRVVDAADLLSPATEASLTAKLAQLEAETTRQLVVATVRDLQGYEIEEYGYGLGREWEIGQKDDDNGAVFVVAPQERRVWVSSGYGLEGVLTDAWISAMVRQQVIPKFRADDMESGIVAGVDSLVTQLSLPPEEARANLAAARESESSGPDWPIGLIPTLFIIWFVVMMLRGALGGRRHRRRGPWGGPVIIWGPGSGGGWGGGSSGGFGGGGFSGGGGSFGGGGAGGSW